MTFHTQELGGIRVLELPAEGPRVEHPTDLISLAFEHRAELLAIPVERLGETFFKLASGLAGELVQKFVNYRIRLAILGDISAHVESSKALRSFVYESNRGSHLWFLEDREALAARLTGGRSESERTRAPVPQR
ncbi:DUF4180 domain-containing protein [Pyxidicoccus xibeiensis]|uniref:DUF4180 domain-containing protein n=1 Tax=Pyxidicoccus xibeiensis TaxID=2906759 RepID=UPI0020A81D92|nr:DUF4180 domain-containing protein [Pyxidicoccus xibeiensis]MCP3135928.1 DUF4180 domain-containing protein [Pyxidicoccus xibeiensis]